MYNIYYYDKLPGLSLNELVAIQLGQSVDAILCCPYAQVENNMIAQLPK